MGTLWKGNEAWCNALALNKQEDLHDKSACGVNKSLNCSALPVAIFHAAIFHRVLRTNLGTRWNAHSQNACTAALHKHYIYARGVWCASLRLDDDDDDGGGGSTPARCGSALVCEYINILFRELIHLATQYFISDNYLAPSTPLSSSCISA